MPVILPVFWIILVFSAGLTDCHGNMMNQSIFSWFSSLFTGSVQCPTPTPLSFTVQPCDPNGGCAGVSAGTVCTQIGSDNYCCPPV
ncbi:hypothetical protein DdX_11147 [Ditylenchus destructor]|uniref:Secreted protein n=1 Tax=Ditylenchus destructor TaxID=166010 RepID=A0AAD4MYR3_9BILA|nr:hypothetical protein DdX_11147 [Ditylenchus destructor]